MKRIARKVIAGGLLSIAMAFGWTMDEIGDHNRDYYFVSQFQRDTTPVSGYTDVLDEVVEPVSYTHLTPPTKA